MTETIDKLDQTPAEARTELAAAMRAREDTPLRGKYRNVESGTMCFVGFAFETLRKKVPDVLFWGSIEGLKDEVSGTYPSGIYNSGLEGYEGPFSRSFRMTCHWLGLNNSQMSYLENASDSDKYSWSQLADALEGKTVVPTHGGRP